MKMRYLTIPALLLLGACATTPKQTDASTDQLGQLAETHPIAFESTPPVGEAMPRTVTAKKNSFKTKNYIGMRGYFKRPPLFTGKNYEVAYQRCAPVEITGVYQSGKTIFVYVKQNGYTFPMIGVNRKDFIRSSNGQVALLDQHFSKDLSFLGAGRQVASGYQKACAGQTWKNMPQNQFLFVTGDPEYRRPIKSEKGQYDVLTYAGANQSSARHYYFLSNKLYSWTQ